MNSEECVEFILAADPRKRKQALEYLYSKCFPKVATFVKANNGKQEEAQDIFQDAIAVLYKNLLEDRYRKEASISSYTYAISRNLWLMELRKRKISTTSIEEVQLSEEEEVRINASLIAQVISRLDQGCKALLTSFYFHSKTMKEIAQQFGLGSSQAAKTKKLRCMKKLTLIIQDYGLNKDHFTL